MMCAVGRDLMNGPLKGLVNFLPMELSRRLFLRSERTLRHHRPLMEILFHLAPLGFSIVVLLFFVGTSSS
jgi:hypothetical protein